MRKNPVLIILAVTFLLFLSSCVKRAPDYLEYQSHALTIKGTIVYDGSESEVVVTLKKGTSPDTLYYRDGSISFTSPSELSGVTVEFSSDGTFISSGDVKIPIHVSTLKIPNIISSLFSFEQSDIRGVTTKNSDTVTLDVIEVKNENLSAQIHIDHESFLPVKIIADIDSFGVTFDILSLEFTDTEENND